MGKIKFSFSAYLAIFQIIFIVLFALFGKYAEKADLSVYPMFMDVHSMMFVGFGFLMTFLKRYGYSSVGFNFIIAAYVLEWALLVRGWVEMFDTSAAKFQINAVNLLVADFCSAAVLISFGAVLGKASLSQLLVMATFEVVIQSINEHIGLHFLKAYDIGESIYVHVFGAYFGLAVAKVLSIGRETESDKEGSNYHSDLFSMIGTIFLWLYWPSFNSATASGDGQLRAVVNTYLAIAASCVATFVISLSVGKGRLNMVHIQNATLAGGVAVGAIADMIIQPYGALIIGSLAGIISTIGFQYITPALNRGFLHDTCGVNNLHGVPGLLSALASGVVASLASREVYGGNGLYDFYPSRIPPQNSTEYVELKLSGTSYHKGGSGRSGLEQGGFQIAALAVTLAMAIVGGLVTGIVMRLPIFEQVHDEEELFDDEPNWVTPADYGFDISDLHKSQAEKKLFLSTSA